MAEFISIDKDKYKVVGILTEDDINKINSFKNRTTLVFDNTVGLSSELVSKITSDRVIFSIKGGLDYDTKEKYKDQNYVDRTLLSPSGLRKIIKYFEYNESMIDPNWNEFEKAMFLYNALVVDIDYDSNYDDTISRGTAERSLNGILYGKLVCSGFALAYKEMLDRVGIKCHYQNKKNTHSFNVIEIDGKKYGVDVTWDNNERSKDKETKKYKCNFIHFGNDPEFYNYDAHRLYDIDIVDFSDENKSERVYDPEEEEFELSLISDEKLQEYYNHIASRINEREPKTLNLGEQSIEIKNKYLPVDNIEYKLKQEAISEYPISVIVDFLLKRDALQIDDELLKAFSARKGYFSDIAIEDISNMYNIDLSVFGIKNYEVSKDGNAAFSDGNERRTNYIRGPFVNNNNMPQEELNELYDNLNQCLSKYFTKYISDILKNLNTLLENYEYEPNEWDTDRSIESANIYTKLLLIVYGRDYLIQLGLNEEEVNNIIQAVNNKINEVHKTNESSFNKKDSDLDFLSVIFDDFNMVKQTMEYDLQKELSDEEFVSLYGNVDYMIELFEKYVIIGGNEKFKFNEYDISKEDLKQLLNELIQKYQMKEMLDEQPVIIQDSITDITK